MNVYVDDMLRPAEVRNGRRVIRGRWSHLLADDPGQLRAFAARLGLNLAWVQDTGTPLEHFDVTAALRRRAIALGAIEISYQESGHLIRAKRAEVPFDLDLLRTDPAGFAVRLAAPIAEVTHVESGSPAAPASDCPPTPSRWRRPRAGPTPSDQRLEHRPRTRQPSSTSGSTSPATPGWSSSPKPSSRA
jgi:hypothetical protein